MTDRVADHERPSNLWRDFRWWIFCLTIFLLELILLALDPTPKLFMGDSGSYLFTALKEWIPPDRSFLYGFIVRWVSLGVHSLTSLLVLQCILGALTAILVAYLCRCSLHLSPGLSYLAGFLCAIDPLQLVWERYVMTETISLFVYVLMLWFSIAYLQQRKLWQIALVQLLGVLLIAFRVSYLLVVQISAVLLPLIAFFPLFRRDLAKQAGIHLALSVGLMFLFHFVYKELNGALAKRPPAYLYSSGFSILATWAPTLLPADSPDPRLAQIISRGTEFGLADPRRRNNQLYSDGCLVDRWKKTEPNLAIADAVAKRTALHSLVHRPLAILALGTKTFRQYFEYRELHKQAQSDLGKEERSAQLHSHMMKEFGLVPVRSKSRTLLQRYFLKAQPYYYVVLLSPFFCGALFFFVREQSVFLLFAHGGIFLATDTFLAVTASVRYLQPLSLLAILFAVLLLHQIRLKRASDLQPAKT